MKLETETGATFDNPSAEQIDSALRDLVESGGGFAILSELEQVYIQTAENGMGECTLEYREGSEENHYCSTSEELSIDEVIKAFQDYAHSHNVWKNRFQWRPLYMDPDAEEQSTVSDSSLSDSRFDPETSSKSGCLGMVLVISAVLLYSLVI